MGMAEAAVVLVLWLAGVALAGDSITARPYLVFNAGGHTAAVNKVCFLDDEQIVSVSNDKTIRFWGIREGEPREVLRPPIGSGLAGALYAVAVSPDGRWLAAGGFEFSGEDHGIYLIRLSDRSMAGVLRGHTNVIIDLKFSPDSRLLASASADKTARVWDVATHHSIATFRGHQDGVYGVAFSPRAERLATASLDGSVRTWPTAGGKAIAVMHSSAGAFQSIDWSPDGKRLAAGCVDQSIRVWSADGDLVRRFQSLGNDVTAVRFTSDSRQLLYTLGGGGPRDGGFLIDLATNRQRWALSGHSNSVLDGALSASNRLAATADANGEIRVWNLASGHLARRFASQATRPWSAGWDSRSRTIAWGTTSDYQSPNQRGPLERAFQLEDLEFVPLSAGFQQATAQRGSASLVLVDAATLVVKRQAGQATRLTPLAEFDQVRCYTFLDEHTVAVGSDFGLLLLDADTGRRLRGLRGHTGSVWALAPSPDGRYLLSAGDDHTLRIWDWSQGTLLMSLFLAGEQWIVWTPQGHYAASPAGERLMGWQLNSESGGLGSFFPAAQFRSSLHRPELIRQLLAAGGLREAVERLSEGASARVLATGVEQVLPPEVEITQPAASPHRVTTPHLAVQARARRRSDQPVLAMRLLLDGRPYEGTKGLYVIPDDPSGEQGVAGSWQIELAPGVHQLAVQAETAVSKSVSSNVEVIYEESAGDAPPRLPDLYVLAVGIADYPGPLKLAYADLDAQRLAATLQSNSGSLFRNVHVKQLRNQQATRGEILKGLTWLRHEMTQSDVAVFFYSGHGAKDDTSTFYLLPVDGDPHDLLATSVSGSQFKDALAAIPGRVLVLLDACHAGAAGGDRRKAVFVSTDDLVRDLVTDDYGVIVMCSSMGREYSRESDDHRQGFFTLALVEALEGRADYNQDGLVYLTEIDTYLADRVKTLTQGQQHPVTSKPATIRSFPLTRTGASDG